MLHETNTRDLLSIRINIDRRRKHGDDYDDINLVGNIISKTKKRPLLHRISQVFDASLWKQSAIVIKKYPHQFQQWKKVKCKGTKRKLLKH